MKNLAEQIESAGFAVVPSILDEGTLGILEQVLPQSLGARGGVRNLLELPDISSLAASPVLRALLDPTLGPQAVPVRAILFDKTPDANWKVTWHQDLTIAVKERVEIDGYGPWSEKDGIVHVQPPRDVLESMLAVRIHLDESSAGNGPLRVLPGSHRAGKLRDAEIPTWRERAIEQVCLVPRGGALLMRPLLIHASSPALKPGHRRVIHIEYASCALPAGLEWRWADIRARAA
jgi:ectoine hydroxylase-related dioxygenase (phytanoyl-CoA dioxygenase family)